MNSSRFHLDRFIARSAASLTGDHLVLDAGAGDCRYACHFAHARYESADFAKLPKAYGELTYVCDLRSIPVEDGRFDAILCTQVLAHLPDPLDVLREFHRVLRPGGSLWLTAPLFFQENEPPYDFYRYTQHGLRHLMTSAGLCVESLEWLEGYAGTASYQLKCMSRWLPISPGALGGGVSGLVTAVLVALLKPAAGAMGALLDYADRRARYTARGHCKNYAIVARKEGDSHGTERG